ncbi:ribosome small subunit-dependent GTPase A [Flavivirga spongiicola]|uniref:Small ribosomal subunit biogenesis GTPase RsgA n=1 Tax=Flavivirga spongiicola TaxID=421621 RepID=A0ABU7XNH6_9FLAO|nr:ribosome small subunit-dependent GTPase A [Flavivirga sp. MEBiC05379]MDO5981765.1 ribosome small subunit-dependent GTPase A [Flavivirga sp. MEBiC05379]
MVTISLQDLGYNKTLEAYRKEQNIDSFDVGRVILEHKDRYIVKTASKEFDAELIGNLRFTAENRYDLPAVGDWVAFSEYDAGKALIHAIYPRHSIIERQAVGKYAQPQIIATNIDYGLIVQSVNRDFNINRLERYLTICNTSNVEPIIVLSKIDLIDELTLNAFLNDIKKRIKDVSVIAISNQSKIGLDNIKAMINKGKTYCLLGSSGVGKSTLLNLLMGKELMNTGAISERIDRGKHVTTHRELIVLEHGGVLIDNPGMREVGITNVSAGLEMTFDDIIELTQNCKFKNCTHINEKGCAILNAVENGDIDSGSYANFQKMEKERAFFESSVEEKRKKDKDFGKMIKNVKKLRKRNKY